MADVEDTLLSRASDDDDEAALELSAESLAALKIAQRRAAQLSLEIAQEIESEAAPRWLGFGAKKSSSYEPLTSEQGGFEMRPVAPTGAEASTTCPSQTISGCMKKDGTTARAGLRARWNIEQLAILVDENGQEEALESIEDETGEAASGEAEKDGDEDPPPALRQ